ncbi:PRD domain-containing protein [Streptomyces sp. CA-278952]|uniref:PRD domain-containing protein n=1 Tax=unclassified Streptomyces TaxID=2593676 RepID=UPI0022423729|nr:MULTISPECIES: PRD domain-containing protein [unclassified Streptomyces]UZI33349.1 PRD domain-containing protein [Streptomyces sp. VB1]WDG33233.1 PRD domain-containing protein [Streptomyces sp. CA-278952]
MDDQLALRIQLFREGGQVKPEVADFVAAELRALEAEGHLVTEATASMLTSHLMMAIGRLLNGEPIEQFLTDDQVAAELADHPEAVARARAVAARAERELGAALPGSEINFLGMHLAVLPRSSPPAPMS